MPVTDQGHVADICAFVNFHGFTPKSVVNLRSSVASSQVAWEARRSQDQDWYGRADIARQNYGCYHA